MTRRIKLLSILLIQLTFFHSHSEALTVLTPPLPVMVRHDPNGPYYFARVQLYSQSTTVPTTIGVAPTTPYSVSNILDPSFSPNPINNQVSQAITPPGASAPDAILLSLPVSTANLNQIIFLPNNSTQFPISSPQVFSASALNAAYGPNLVLGLEYPLAGNFDPADAPNPGTHVYISQSSPSSSPASAAYFNGLMVSHSISLPFNPATNSSTGAPIQVIVRLLKLIDDGRQRLAVLSTVADSPQVGSPAVGNKLAVIEPSGETRCTLDLPLSAYAPGTSLQDMDILIGNLDSSYQEKIILKMQDTISVIDPLNCLMDDTLTVTPPANPVVTTPILTANGGVNVLPTSQQQIHISGPFLADSSTLTGAKNIIVVANRVIGNVLGVASAPLNTVDYTGVYTQRYVGVINFNSTLNITWYPFPTSASVVAGPVSDFGDTPAASSNDELQGCFRVVLGNIDAWTNNNNPKLACMAFTKPFTYLSGNAISNPTSCGSGSTPSTSCYTNFRSQYAIEVMDLTNGATTNFLSNTTSALTTTTSFLATSTVLASVDFSVYNPVVLANIDSDPALEVVTILGMSGPSGYLNGYSNNGKYVILNNNSISKNWVPSLNSAGLFPSNTPPQTQWYFASPVLFPAGSGNSTKLCKAPFYSGTFPSLPLSTICTDNTGANPVKLTYVASPGPGITPMLVDRDLDGKLDIIGTASIGYGGGLSALEYDPATNSAVSGSEQAFLYGSELHHTSAKAIGDLYGDGALEIIATSTQYPSILKVYRFLGQSSSGLAIQVYKPYPGEYYQKGPYNNSNDGFIGTSGTAIPPTVPTQLYSPPAPFTYPEPLPSGAPVSAPTNVTASITNLSPLQVTVGWSPVTSGGYYDVQHSVNQYFGYKTVAQTAIGQNSAVISHGFVSGIRNYYRVVARLPAPGVFSPGVYFGNPPSNPGNPSGAIGIFVPSISIPAASPAPTGTPSVPTSFSVNGVSNNTNEQFIALNWQHSDPASNVFYEINDISSSSSVTPLFSGSVILNSYSTYFLVPPPTGLLPTNPSVPTATFRIRACRSLAPSLAPPLCSAWSPNTGTSLSFLYPTTPSNLTSSLNFASSPPSIDFAWNDNSNTETSFTLERQISGGSSWFPVCPDQPTGSPCSNFAIPANTTSLNYPFTTFNTNYIFRIKSVNAYGSGPASNTSTIMTPLASPSPSPSPSISPQPSASATPSASPSPSTSPAASPSSSPMASASASPSAVASASPVASPSASASLNPIASPSSSPSAAPSFQPSPSITPTSSLTPSPSASASASVSPSASTTPSALPSVAPSVAASASPSVSASATPSQAPLASPSASASMSPSASASATPSPNTSPVAPNPSSSPGSIASPTASGSITPSPSAGPIFVVTSLSSSLKSRLDRKNRLTITLKSDVPTGSVLTTVSGSNCSFKLSAAIGTSLPSKFTLIKSLSSQSFTGQFAKTLRKTKIPALMRLKKYRKKTPKVYLSFAGTCTSPLGLLVAEAPKVSATFKPKLGGSRALSASRYLRLLKKIK